MSPLVTRSGSCQLRATMSMMIYAAARENDDAQARSVRTENVRKKLASCALSVKLLKRRNEATHLEPAHEEVKSVVERLNVEEEHSKDVVIRSVEAREVDETVDAGGERTIQPATALTDAALRIS